ncbi:methyl-accepting chemotaxis protein [Terrarubrum flagellatum]|uniref:methyl-accepting chemotaxis protein n=1 Tax=Terrirubrum flagellatum TaxID=2895980 RepID=UPI003144FF81
MSINTILKSVILALVAGVIILLANDARQSWSRYVSESRISAVVGVTTSMFTALHNLRVDRAITNRDIDAEKPFTTLNPQITGPRAAEMPALKSAIAGLSTIDFVERDSAIASLDQAVRKLAALQEESAAALMRPKSERRAGLKEEYFAHTSAVLETIDKLSLRLTRLIKRDDAFIDQLMEIKQFAWIARNTAGDASVLVTTYAGKTPPPNLMAIYQGNLGKFEIAWSAVEGISSDLPLPSSFAQAMEKAKRDNFAQDFVDLRQRMIAATAAGQKMEMTEDQWAPYVVPRLGSLLGVADAALEAAKEHAGRQSAEAMTAFLWQLGFVVAALIVGFGILLMVSRRVTAPLRQIQAAMQKVAQGDFDVVLPGLNRKDEIGDVANSVERFKVLAVEKSREEAELALRRQQEETERHAQAAKADADAQALVAEERMRAAEEQGHAMQALGDGLSRLSEGDLTFRLTSEFPQAYQEIRDNFNAMATQMSEALAAIKASTVEVSNASAEISASTTDLSQRTEEQAASLEQTSASMEEIAATVRKNAENAQTANQSAVTTQQVAQRGGEVVAEAVQAMARIEESSRKISDIIGVIDEIARQTNLLALNAAVEAARAGEAGRGFAVVASEVRSLAQRSSQAAKDIKELIVSSGGQVKDGVDLVNRAGASLAEIVASIKSVASVVADIASASAEQSVGVAEVNKALQQMDEATQQNSALVEQNAATAKTLESQAKAMDERVSYFRVEGAATAAPAVKRAAPAVKSARPAPQRPAGAATRSPVARMQAAVATAFNNDSEWQEF